MKNNAGGRGALIGFGVIAASIAAIGSFGPQVVELAGPALATGGAGAVGALLVSGLWYSRRSGSDSQSDGDEQSADSSGRRQAYYDVLTGLPNRALFNESMKRLKDKPPDDPIGVLVFNLDQFKSINESLGPEIADNALCVVSERISKALNKKDKLFRIGGDEFVALVQGCNGAELQILADRIIRRIKRDFQVEEMQVSLTTSVGAALWPEDHEDMAKIVDCAETAAKSAKSSGGDRFVRFCATMRRETDGLRNVLSELPEAVKKKQFELFYQPRLNVSSGRVESFEALLRWNHPERGLLTPDKFIDVLENSPMIIEAGNWALESACRQVVQWCSQGHNLRVSVNIAARQFRHRHFVRSVRNILDRTMTSPALIELEITESQLLGDLDAAAKTIEELKLIGVTVSIDDFGTGYSSLAYLHKLPIDSLKIDRSFVQGIDKSPMEGRVASAIHSLGHTLGLRVVAEGVETEEQAEQLKRWGCDEMQGYRFGKPQPIEKINEMLAAAPTRDHPELVADEVIEIQAPA